MKIKYIFPFVIAGLLLSCKKDDVNQNPSDDEGPRLIFRMKLDPNQERLDNLGMPADIALGNAAQNPSYNGIAIHYIELSPTMYTPIGSGEIIYIEPSATLGGEEAIAFDNLDIINDGDVAYSIPLSQVAAGSYNYARAAVAYQNYDVEFTALDMDLTGTLASFVGYNNYITSYKVNTKTVHINGNKKQGYWTFETQAIPPYVEAQLEEGQAPGVTVPNPLHATSPIPEGSCTLTGAFAETFVITGNETQDIIIDLSYSINNSFEWVDLNENGKFDPLDGETVVDMGLRGLIPIVVQ